MRPWKPLEKGGGAGEKAWQSLVQSIGEETILGSKPPIPYGRKVWEEAIGKGEIPFDPGAVPLALLKRTVLREASKAAMRGRKGFVGALRKKFDETARRLFGALREFPEKAFEPLEEVGFPKKVLDPTFGEVRGLVSYGSRSKPWLKMQVALASKHIEEVAHTARHEMGHVGQIAARKQWYEPAVEMERARRKLFRETPTLEPRRRWELDPTERHAEMFAEVMERISKKRTKQGPLGWEEYKTIFRETIPEEFLAAKEYIPGKYLKDIKAIRPPGGPSPQVAKEITPERMTKIVERMVRTKDPSGTAVAFGYKHRGSAKVGEALREAREGILRKTLDKSIPLQERMEMGLPSQLLREALEELEGRVPKGFGFLEVRAKRAKVPSSSIVPQKITKVKQPWQMTREEFGETFWLRGTTPFRRGMTPSGGRSEQAKRVAMRKWAGSDPSRYSAGPGGKLHLFPKEDIADLVSGKVKKGAKPIMTVSQDALIEGRDAYEAVMIQAFREGKLWVKVPSPSPSIVPTKRPYQTASDELMGFRKIGEQKGYFETAYRHEQKVRVKFPGEKAFSDQIKGLNKPHALERARRNWPGAKITPGWGE